MVSTASGSRRPGHRRNSCWEAGLCRMEGRPSPGIRHPSSPTGFTSSFKEAEAFPGCSRKTSGLPKFSKTGLCTPLSPTKKPGSYPCCCSGWTEQRRDAGAGHGGFWIRLCCCDCGSQPGSTGALVSPEGNGGDALLIPGFLPARSLTWSLTSTILGALCPLLLRFLDVCSAVDVAQLNYHL